MIYVTSDLHGYPLADFQSLLNRAGFTQEDFLFVLGDVIDRGESGAQLLLWLTQQPNMELILGNHEAMLLACEFLFDEITQESLARLDRHRLGAYQNWLANGGAPTIAGLKELLSRDQDAFWGILDYLKEAPLYEALEVGGREFLLVHSGIDGFSREKPLDFYPPEAFLWHRPGLDTRFYEDRTVIFGHTPTVYFGKEKAGKAVHAPGWICIDTGAACGGSPMVLCLDNMKETY